MTSVSSGHIILTPTQPVGSGRTQRVSNPRPRHQESRALPTELPPPPLEDVADTADNGRDDKDKINNNDGGGDQGDELILVILNFTVYSNKLLD